METMPNKPKTLTRPCYTLAVEGKHAELTMYGQIVETWPVDWWTGERIEGQFIALQDFLADLESIKDAETLTIHMNSVGGDGYSAITIHNRLRTIPAEKTAIVEGVAMSGGSLIICACEHTKAFANSLILWHHAWTYIWGAYNAPELHKEANGLEGMDKSQAEIYMRKTGKTLEEVTAIMNEERHLTGREAYEMGLIDELLDETEEEDLDIAVSADKRTLFVKGHQMRIAAMGELPKGIKVVEAAPAPGSESGFDNKEPDASGKKGGNDPMTWEEFCKSNPEAAEALRAEAQAANEADIRAKAAADERKRISEIDDIASLYGDDVVKAAKYGDKACTAAEMAYRAALENAKQGKKFMEDSKKDYKDSGAGDVGAAPASEETDKPQTNEDKMAAGEAMAKALRGENKEV